MGYFYKAQEIYGKYFNESGPEKMIDEERVMEKLLDTAKLA